MTDTTRFDVMDPARAAACVSALGLDAAVPPGSVLPPFFHHLYFWEALPPHDLGPDGHPKVGGLIPDMGLPRRMWAGGRLTFIAPLRAGVPAEKRSLCSKAERKDGRSGPLAFVTLTHEIWQDGALCVTEHQDLVYRQAADPAQPKPAAQPARTDEAEARDMAFNSTLLFRYSALTFNGHRIHYDEDYARHVEGYDGLVVHGPLLAQMLMLMAFEAAPLMSFAFRATAPLMHWERATLCRKGADLWVRGPDGRLVMQATAV